MAKATQRFDHQTPSAPTLTKGAWLGASGVNAPIPQRIGAIAGGVSLGSFADYQGFGDIKSDADGALYVCDYDNNRIQRLTKNASGVWDGVSSVTVSSLIGSNVVCMAIDVGKTP